MKIKLLYVLLLIAILNAGISLACTTPVENLSIGSTTTLCSGNYSIPYNMVVGASNIIISCNDTKLIGNNAFGRKAFDLNFNSNVTIQHCEMINFSNAIYGSHPDNVYINNNTIINTAYFMIRSLNSGSWIIENNTFYNEFGLFCMNATGTYADYFDCNGTAITVDQGADAYNIIRYNDISFMKYGVYISQDKHFTNITNNNIHHIGSNGYNIGILNTGKVNDTYIGYNNLSHGWDTILDRGTRTIIEYNNITGMIHHGIDTLINETWASTDYTTGGHIRFNRIIENGIYSDPSYNTTARCIFIEQKQGIQVYNNYCYNSTISVTGNPAVTNNISVYNNVVDGASQISYYILAPALLYNNTANNTNIWGGLAYDFYYGADYDNKSAYTLIVSDNNTVKNSYNTTYVEASNINLTIYDDDYFNITWGGGGQFNLFYDTNKTIRIENKSFNIYNLMTPYNDIYNYTSSSFIANNQINYSQNIINNMLLQIKSSCAYPTNTTYSNSTVFCTGNYSTWGLKLGTNANITCEGTILYGNTSGNGIESEVSTSHNVQIRGCTIENFEYGIRDNGGDNWVVQNVTLRQNTYGTRFSGTSINITFENSTIQNSTYGYYGIANTNSFIRRNTFTTNTEHINIDTVSSNNDISYNDFQTITDAAINMVSGSNNEIKHNTFNSANSASTNYGIRIQGAGSGTQIINNTGNGRYYGIFIAGGHAYTNVLNNTWSNAGLWNIHTAGNYTNISGNIAINSSWNGIHYQAYNNSIYNNTVVNFLHHGIDTHNDNNVTWSGYNQIHDNAIIQTDDAYMSGGAGIFIQASKHDQVYSNNLINLYNATKLNYSTRGIAVEGGDLTFGVSVYNNTLTNCSAAQIYDDSYNTTYSYNTFSKSSGIYTFYVFGSWDLTTNITYSTFSYNTDDKTLLFYLNDRVNITINENKMFILNSSSTTGNRVVNINVAGSTFNDLYNDTGQAYVQTDIVTYILSFPKSQQYTMKSNVCEGDALGQIGLSNTLAQLGVALVGLLVFGLAAAGLYRKYEEDGELDWKLVLMVLIAFFVIIALMTQSLNINLVAEVCP